MAYIPPLIAETPVGRYMVFTKHDYISKELLKGDVWEPMIVSLCDLFMKNGEGLFLDLGANLGATCIPIARRHPERSFVAIEAQRVVFNMLTGNVALNGLTNVYPMHAAVVGPEQSGQSIAVPTPDYAQEIYIGAVSVDPRVNPLKTSAGSENVKAVSIDALGLPRIAVVKIDVEGYELPVLKGMRQSLIDSGLPPIVYETWRKDQYAWMEQEKAEIEALLNEIGYQIDYVPHMTTAIAQARNAPKKASIIAQKNGEKIDIQIAYD